jgi:hypothetical protein
MPTNVLLNNQNESSTVDTNMNVDLYRYTNDDNDSQSGNQGIGIVETNIDDSQAEVVHQERDESDIPNQLFVEVALITEPVKTLLQHQTRGIPKPTYEPELSSRVKYPMSYYMSNHRLIESNVICKSIMYCIYS